MVWLGAFVFIQSLYLYATHRLPFSVQGEVDFPETGKEMIERLAAYVRHMPVILSHLTLSPGALKHCRWT